MCVCINNGVYVGNRGKEGRYESEMVKIRK